MRRFFLDFRQRLKQKQGMAFPYVFIHAKPYHTILFKLFVIEE